jgi:hypothetical protein
VRRLKINAAAWAVGTIAVTGLWVLNQWQENGRFEHFGSHAGNPGDWNPTLWALIVGVWSLVVGIMALQVHFERPATEAKIDHEVSRLRRQTRLEGNRPMASLGASRDAGSMTSIGCSSTSQSGCSGWWC